MDTLPLTIAVATVVSWVTIGVMVTLRNNEICSGTRTIVWIWVLPLSMLLTTNMALRLLAGYHEPTRIFTSAIAMFYIFAFVVTSGYLITNRKR